MLDAGCFFSLEDAVSRQSATFDSGHAGGGRTTRTAIVDTILRDSPLPRSVMEQWRNFLTALRRTDHHLKMFSYRRGGI